MSTFLTAAWRKLIMAQYAVDPSTLAPWLPRGTELDLFHGQCFVSLVGFLFDRVRIKGLPIPGYTRFEEINLRFYVRRVEEDGTVKRGVVFVREIVPRAMITLVANLLYDEPYATMPTRHTIYHPAHTLRVNYEWKDRGPWYAMEVVAKPQAAAITPGSVEDFITEHYWGYTKRRNDRTAEYEVRHPRWQVYPVLRHSISADFGALYGPAFAHLDSADPDSVLLAEGSAVSVHSGLTIVG